MKKILVFATTFPSFLPWDTTPGFVYDLSKRLQKLWLQIIVLTPRVPWSKKYEEKDGMRIYRFPYFFRSQWETLNDWAILPNIKKNKLLLFQVPFLLLAGFFYLIKIVKNEKIDTIHSHWIIPQWFLSVLYKKLFNKNIKILCTTHGWDIFWLRWKIGTMIKKFTLKNIDKLTVVSNAIKTECVKLWIAENKIDVISMWVDTELFSPNNYDENIKKQYNINGKFLLFVGRLAEKKWVTYLIQAMRWIVDKYSDTKLMIIWNWPLEQELKNEVKELKLENNIIFTWGIQNNQLPKYYATADIFVWPSIIAKDGDSEWFWLVFVEAILSGCITFWSELYWITDIIENWKTGYLIKPNDSKDIEEKIKYILENDDFDEDNARSIISKKFGWDEISEKYFSLLNSN